MQRTEYRGGRLVGPKSKLIVGSFIERNRFSKETSWSKLFSDQLESKCFWRNLGHVIKTVSEIIENVEGNTYTDLVYLGFMRLDTMIYLYLGQ